MTQDSSVTHFFASNSRTYPIVRLLTNLKEVLLEYAISLTGDAENGYAKVKLPIRYYFRFCDKIVKQFAYRGLSFDRMIIAPKYKNINKTTLADNVEVHLYVNKDPKENRLQILFKR